MEEEIKIIEEYLTDPLKFIEDMFWLTPQEVLPEYKTLLEDCRKTWDYWRIKSSMFNPFTKYKNLTWQQVEIVLAVSRAVNGEDKRKIVVKSWHGIGKSSIISIIIIRFLFCFYQSVVGCTAPTQIQMQDVLWKELSLWKDRLPENIRNMFEHTQNYLRVWYTDWDKAARYARARTAAKEHPEALAGLHADDLMIIADEASWVPDEIFETAMSAMTNSNFIFLMISNPTRLEWYFYNAFTDNADTFQTLSFNSEESPIVDRWFVNNIINDYGKDSDQYRVRVLWEFPKAWLIDDKGWIPLFDPNEITFVSDEQIQSEISSFDKLWIDPSWNGKDFTSFVARNNFYAKRIAREDKSTEKSIALKTVQLKAILPRLIDDKIFYDNFWVGANVWTELAKEWIFARWLNVGNEADDKTTFLNKRAECYWRLKKEIKQWFKLIWTAKERSDLLMIKYKRTIKGQIRIMDKTDMRKEFGKSPDDADALALTFRDNPQRIRKPSEEREIIRTNPFTWEIKKVRHLSHKLTEAW